MIRTGIVAAFLGIYTLILGPPFILLALLTRSADCLYWVGVKGLVFITWVVGLRVQAEGLENIPPGACLFAANHTSNADACAIVTVMPRRIAVFGRKSLFDIPIVGYAFHLAHFVPVDRGNRESALQSVEQAVGYIKEGSSFLAYPEGTRSADGKLREFKKGSFVMAIKAGIPVVPVACAGAHRVMKKKSLVIHPGKVLVRFGRPIDASIYTVEQRGDLAVRVHEAVARMLPEDQQPEAWVAQVNS